MLRLIEDPDCRTGTDALPEVRTRVRIPLRRGRESGGEQMSVEMVSFRHLTDKKEHLAIVSPWSGDTPVVRIHSECMTGDVFGSLLCDCGAQLGESVELLATTGGIILYMRHEGRGIGLYNKLDAYHLQACQGLDTFEANAALGFAEDARDFGVAAEMLYALGVFRVELLTNNPDKIVQLARHGIEVVTIRSTCTFLTEHNASYLVAKRERGGHRIAIGALKW